MCAAGRLYIDGFLMSSGEECDCLLCSLVARGCWDYKQCHLYIRIGTPSDKDMKKGGGGLHLPLSKLKIRHFAGNLFHLEVGGRGVGWGG